MPAKTKSWFDVSKEGLRQLQEGKPKHYILRELIQNAFDEPITTCMVLTKWENVRRAQAIPSSSQLFGSSTATGEPVEPTIMMLSFRNLAERIAKQCLSIEIQVRFMKWDGVAAQYGNKTLTMNVQVLGADWFITASLSKRIAIILHELAHENGSHTEHSYHETLTNLGGELVELALRNPKFFPEL